jgi:hypothetical protein
MKGGQTDEEQLPHRHHHGLRTGDDLGHDRATCDFMI